MKIIFFFLLLITTSAIAQHDSIPRFDSSAWHKKAANDYAKGGVILQFAGCALGVYMIENNLDNNKNTLLLPAGLIIAGVVLEGISISHTIHSKKNMEILSLSLKNGVTLRWAFN